uniref:hypothetical protein n=1 Tax=Pseudonocardia sp. CA-138482 TaxID=3240023 RepID=UPI003F49520B
MRIIPSSRPGLEHGYAVRGLGPTYDEGHRVHADSWPEAEQMAEAKRAEGWRDVRIQPLDFLERDNQVCTCGHRCRSHGSFNPDREFVGIGQGDCHPCREQADREGTQRPSRGPCAGFQWAGVSFG